MSRSLLSVSVVYVPATDTSAIPRPTSAAIPNAKSVINFSLGCLYGNSYAPVATPYCSLYILVYTPLPKYGLTNAVSGELKEK